MKLSASTLSAVLFVGMMALTGVLSLWAGARAVMPELPAFGFEDSIKGKATRAFEDKFAQAAPAYDLSRTLWGTVDYLLFHEGRDGVIVGNDGWLYSSEEFSWPKNADETVRRNLEYVAAAQAQLSQKNIPLLVAVVPAKARVKGEYLGRFRLPEGRGALYDRIVSDLSAKGMTVVDLRGVMTATPDSFLRTDTHWTPDGAKAAAEKIAESLKGLAAARGVPFGTAAFSSSVDQADQVHSGDLLRYVPMGRFAERGPAPDRFSQYKTESAGTNEGGGDLFGDAVIPYTLVGTSYSADERWNFAGFLKQSIGADVLNAADPGQGPFATMKAYLESKAFLDTPPQFIIWEMPERYFPISTPVTEK